MPTTVTTTVSQSRAYDHVYDPVYTVSDSRDHSRAHMNATSGFVERIPEHANMFSEINLYPNHSYRMNQKDKLPSHIDKNYKGTTSAVNAVTTKMDTLIEGRNRHRYFRRPIVPYIEAIPPEVLLATSPQVDIAPQNSHTAFRQTQSPVNESKRSVGVQTAYRDSEAQTDPYTPDYTIRPGDTPEVLGLAHLSFKHGLPAGLGQVENIQRSRDKRIFESSLPPMTDEANLELRKRMISAQELIDWKARESEIDKMQSERLAMLKGALEQREKESEFITEQRVEALKQEKNLQKDKAIAAIQRKRIKALRKLSKARKDVEPKSLKRDIISEYSDYSSEVYAPIKISGKHPDRTQRTFTDASIDISTTTVEGLSQLERNLNPKLITAKITKPDNELLMTSASRKDKLISTYLDQMKVLIETSKDKTLINKPPTPPPTWKKKIDRVVRPDTPNVIGETDVEAEEFTNAVILIQKLLRGRAVQNRMFEGKEQRLELIKELRISEPLNTAHSALVAADAVEAAASHRHAAIETSIEAVYVEVISTMLDFMSKQLVRVKAETRIADLVRRAETNRRSREAEESGRRQAESIIRAREDLIFQQIMQTHQNTVDSYLESIIHESINKSADVQSAVALNINDTALTGTPITADIDNAAYEADGVVVRDLIGSFLLPEVNRKRVQHKLNQEEARFVDAARTSLSSSERAVKEVFSEHK